MCIHMLCNSLQYEPRIDIIVIYSFIDIQNLNSYCNLEIYLESVELMESLYYNILKNHTDPSLHMGTTNNIRLRKS